MSTSLSLGFVLGATENTVPPGAIIRHLKFCENCPRLFARDAGSTRKFCAECCRCMLMPVDDSEYREILPQIAHHSRHLIHYDDSLFNPRGDKKYPKRDRSKDVSSSSWKDKVIAAFKEKGQLDSLEIEKVIGSKTTQPGASRCQAAGICLERVGFVRRRPGQTGRMPGIYILAGVEITH